jgi:hypothetical protein
MLAALSALVFVASLFVGVPATLYLSNREEARRRWRPRPMELVAVGDGGYRGAEVTRLEALGPPAHVHLTAVMCWVLGMAFVPGLLAGLYGFFFLWVGLVSVPGLVLAMRLLRLGGPLLRGEAEAVPKARAAARFARGLNYVVLGLAGLVGLTALPVQFLEGDTHDAWAIVAGLCPIVVYAAISLLHARLLDRSAETLEAELEAQRVEATRVRVALAGAPAAEVELAAAYATPEAAQASALRRGD